MDFDNYPSDYQSIFHTTAVSIYGCDPAQPTDVELIECYRNATLGIRRLTGMSYYSFDPVGYLCHTISHYPMPPYQGPWILPLELHTLKLKVRTGVLESPVALLTCARDRVVPDTLLSSMPNPKRLARNGFDEMSVILKDANTYAVLRFFGPEGAQARIDSSSNQITHEMACLSFGLSSIASDLVRQGYRIEQFDRLEVTWYANDRPIHVQEYLLEESNPESTAIAWVNAQGAIDVYTMCRRRHCELSVKRSVGQSFTGNHLLSALQADTLIDLITDYEPHATIEWLSGMLTAPNVWIVTEHKAIEVQITASQNVVSEERPTRLQITCKPATPIPYQKIG